MVKILCLISIFLIASCTEANKKNLTRYLKEKHCESFCEELKTKDLSIKNTPIEVKEIEKEVEVEKKVLKETLKSESEKTSNNIKTSKDCKLLRWNDGRGGMLFLKSATQKGWKFLTPGLYGKPEKIFFCTNNKCFPPNPPYKENGSGCGGFANPDHTPQGKIERWHACTPTSADEIRVDDCPILQVSKKCINNGRCD